jgi:hypothetical protein
VVLSQHGELCHQFVVVPKVQRSVEPFFDRLGVSIPIAGRFGLDPQRATHVVERLAPRQAQGSCQR